MPQDTTNRQLSSALGTPSHARRHPTFKRRCLILTSICALCNILSMSLQPALTTTHMVCFYSHH